MKSFFEKSTPAHGNKNTINVAAAPMISYEQTKRFDSKHSANYKMMTEGSEGFFSIDTGQSGFFMS